MKTALFLAAMLIPSVATAATPKPSLAREVAAGVGLSGQTVRALKGLREALDAPGQECGGAGRFAAMEAARTAATVGSQEPQALRLVADAMDVLQGACEAPTLATVDAREKVIVKLFRAERGGRR